MKKLALAVSFIALALAVDYTFINVAAVKHKTSDRIPASVATRSVASLNAGEYTFHFKDLAKKDFSIKKQAISYEEAYRSASKECFQRLTGGKYPGEDLGLHIIDICANPKS